MNIPRLRGKVGQFEDPPEFKGKWGFELSMWTFDGETQVGEPMNFGPFDTEEEAHQEMKRATRFACDSIEKSFGHEPSGKYIDLKNGAVLRPWDEQ